MSTPRIPIGSRDVCELCSKEIVMSPIGWVHIGEIKQEHNPKPSAPQPPKDGLGCFPKPQPVIRFDMPCPVCGVAVGEYHAKECVVVTGTASLCKHKGMQVIYSQEQAIPTNQDITE